MDDQQSSSITTALGDVNSTATTVASISVVDFPPSTVDNDSNQIIISQLQSDNKSLLAQLKTARRETLQPTTILLNSANVQNIYQSNLESITLPHSSSDSPLTALPSSVLVEIFKKIPKLSTLLRCRAVCSTWKQLIDNSSELKSRFTIHIWNLELFFALSSSFRSQAHTILFENVNCSFLQEDSSPTKSKLINFLRSSNIQSIKFNLTFKITETEQSHLLTLYELINNECKSLKELYLLQNPNIPRSGIFSCNGSLQNIVRLSVVVTDCNGTEFNQLKLFLAGLAKLKYFSWIARTFGRNTQSDALVSLCLVLLAHMKTYPKVLQKIYYGNPNPAQSGGGFMRNNSNTAILIGFQCAAAALYGVEFIHLNVFDLVALTYYPDVIDPANELQCVGLTASNLCTITKAIFQYFEHDSAVEFEARANNFYKLHNCRDIQELEISATGGQYRPDVYTALFRHLTKLKVLKLKNITPEAHVVNNGRLPYTIFEGAEGMGIPSCRSLTLHGSIFESPECAFTNLHLYFPNLKRLSLESMHDLPNDLFVNLGGLIELKYLNLKDLQNLTDATFTSIENLRGQEEEDLAAISIPAIARLKALVQLSIGHCPNLTELCLLDGICANENIKTLVLGRSGGCSNIIGAKVMEHGKISLKKLDKKSLVFSLIH